MESTVFFKTERNNCYLYDYNTSLALLCHPLFEQKMNEDNNNYYKTKYAYLKNHGFFGKLGNRNFSLLSESQVEKGIANTEQIVFEVTDKCNLRCKYCGFGDLYDSYDARNNSNLDINSSLQLIRYVFSLAKNYRKENPLVIGFYGGEPLLNIDFIQTIVKEINTINEYNIPIEYSLTTNATLLHKCYDFLVENRFKLLISLDGNEFNHSYRTYKNGMNSFHSVIKNVDILQQKYPTYFEKNVRFNAVLHNRNSVESIYDFIFNRYGKKPRIGEITDTGVCNNKKEEFMELFRAKKEDMDTVNASFKSTIDILDMPSYNFLLRFINHYTVFIYTNMLDFFLNEKAYLPTGTCLPFSKKIYHTINNKFLPCEKIDYKYSLGKIEDNRVYIDINDITEKYNDLYKKLIKYCNKCYTRNFCGVCFYSIVGIDFSNPKCPFFYNKKRFMSLLKSMFTLIETDIDNYYVLRDEVTIT